MAGRSGVVALCVVALGLAGCGATASPPTPTSTPTTAPTATPSPTGPKVFAVGQTMTNGAHQTVTVTSFIPNSPVSQYSTPNPGDECVQVNVALRNGDSSPWLDPLDELAVVDASGQTYDDSAFDCAGTSDSIDSLIAGGTATATLYFEVPATGKLTLQWTPNMFNANSVYNTELKAS